MRVVCPHAGTVEEGTRSALDKSGWAWEPVDVSSADTAYAELLQSLWMAGETFAIVEHDVVIRPGVLDELAECGAPWCAFPYQLGERDVAGLGCTKFAALLTKTRPHAVEKTWAEHTLVHPAGHWCNLDDRLTRVLTAAGAVRHVHTPSVRHLRPAPTHGCT